MIREPDSQLGYLAGGWLTMGQILSLTIIASSLVAYAFLARIKRPYARG
jgi:phosphatidylglycerol:prolipoprotein diacylglycerol transferase